MLAQFNGVPVQVKDVAKVSVGYVRGSASPAGPSDDDVALAIVVMGRTTIPTTSSRASRQRSTR